MQAQNFTELKKVATIGYIISGLSLGLWSSALLPRLNLAVVGAVAGGMALSPVRKRQTEQAVADAKQQLDAEHAERRDRLKDWEKELQSRSVDLDALQMDLDRERERWEQERVIADRSAESEILDRARELEAEYEKRFTHRQIEIDQEYAALDSERKAIDLEHSKLESDKERFELNQEQIQKAMKKASQETVNTALVNLELDRQELEVQANTMIADRLEPLHERIADLEAENEELHQQLAVATYPKIPRGLDRVCVYLREVIPALYKLGFRLDYDHHDTSLNRDRVWLHPQHSVDLKELDKQSGLIQGLIGSKHPLSWQWVDRGLIQLEVSTAGVETTPKTSKKKIADRIVDNEQWLIDLVKKCFHFRVCGENGSGKSEFFNNLYCIAKYRVFGGKLDLTLMDPKFPLSPWIIEGEPFIPQYRKWEEIPMGVADMAALVDGRISRAQQDFQPQHWIDGTSPDFAPSMWAIDETDTTMSRYKKEMKDNLRVGLKVGRALRVMVCYMCQSYLPTDIGLNHPDLKASANILLSTSAENGAEELPMSKERRLEIKEEIAYLNAEGCKFFALVKYPGVQPFVARLPKPKAYSHLRFEPEMARGRSESGGSTLSLPGSSAVPNASSLRGEEFGNSGLPKTLAGEASLGGAQKGTSTGGIAPSAEASQSEIDRVIGLLNDGMTSQEKIINSVWGVKKSSRKSSTYQKKVTVVKAIKQAIADESRTPAAV